MKCTDIYSLIRSIKDIEVNELTLALRSHKSRKVRFEDESNEIIIILNTDFDGPQDYTIREAGLEKDNGLYIKGFLTRGYDTTEEYLDLDDILPGQIQFITEAVPPCRGVDDVSSHPDILTDGEILQELTLGVVMAFGGDTSFYEKAGGHAALMKEIRDRAAVLSEKYHLTDWTRKDFWLTMEDETAQLVRELARLTDTCVPTDSLQKYSLILWPEAQKYVGRDGCLAVDAAADDDIYLDQAVLVPADEQTPQKDTYIIVDWPEAQTWTGKPGVLGILDSTGVAVPFVLKQISKTAAEQAHLVKSSEGELRRAVDSLARFLFSEVGTTKLTFYNLRDLNVLNFVYLSEFIVTTLKLDRLGVSLEIIGEDINNENLRYTFDLESRTPDELLELLSFLWNVYHLWGDDRIAPDNEGLFLPVEED